MKKGLILFVCVMMLFCFLSVPAVASNTSLHFAVFAETCSDFHIENNTAVVSARYISNTTAEIESATITITLQKRFLLAFWDTLVEQTDYYTSSAGTVSFEHPVSSGHYKVTVHYEIHLTDGTNDAVNEVHEASN